MPTSNPPPDAALEIEDADDAARKQPTAKDLIELIEAMNQSEAAQTPARQAEESKPPHE